MTESADGRSTSPMIELPEKTYFKIGEVAKLLDVEPYVLRYWETEFDVLEPDKTKSGQRVYQRGDIELLLQIRSLLYEEMFTIAGARRQLERSRQGKTSYFDIGSAVATDRGSALAGDEELRRDLEAARQELVESQNKLGRIEEAYEQTKSEALHLHEEVALLRAEVAEQSAESNGEAIIEELQGEVAELRDQLQAAQAQAEQERQALRRTSRERDSRRTNVLGALRREVEALAAMADPGRSRA